MNEKDPTGLKTFLDRKVAEYNTKTFIAPDPVSVPHRFTKKQDIEIAALFAAVFSWGNRTTIINKSLELIQLMDNDPYNFIKSHIQEDLKGFLNFKHRTFNTTDLLYFLQFLQHHFQKHSSLETAFLPNQKPVKNNTGVKANLIAFHKYFFSLNDAPLRTAKHISTPERNSACKRLNMFLRWMVRNDKKGVDFGIWNSLKPSNLICPLDLHVARVARHFNLLERKQTDWLAAEELTNNLRNLDPLDPVKYDYALFGLGVIEKF